MDPPCVTELAFEHEFYVSSNATRRSSRCRTWQFDSDWPTADPYLLRSTVQPRPRGIWDTLALLPNRTVWLHGDSIQLQLCGAAMCSLMRAGVAPYPAWQPKPDWLKELNDKSGLQIQTSLLPNGARLLCSGIGVFQPGAIGQVLEIVDVAMLNFGLHYSPLAKLEGMVQEAMAQLGKWQSARPQQRVALWRESSAQHYPGGAYEKGAERPPPGSPCMCSPLSASAEKSEYNLNVAAVAAERREASRHGVALVPFFNLTAPRFDMHRAHFCSYHNQRRVGTCCDCTHFCYTPLFWDVFFAGLYRTLRRHSRSELQLIPRPAAAGFRARRPRPARGAARPAARTAH